MHLSHRTRMAIVFAILAAVALWVIFSQESAKAAITPATSCTRAAKGPTLRFHCDMLHPEWFAIIGDATPVYSVLWSLNCGPYAPARAVPKDVSGDFAIKVNRRNTLKLPSAIMKSAVACRLDVELSPRKGPAEVHAVVAWGSREGSRYSVSGAASG
jgi:hypothetical protein